MSLFLFAIAVERTLTLFTKSLSVRKYRNNHAESISHESIVYDNRRLLECFRKNVWLSKMTLSTMSIFRPAETRQIDTCKKPSFFPPTPLNFLPFNYATITSLLRFEHLLLKFYSNNKQHGTRAGFHTRKLLGGVFTIRTDRFIVYSSFL